MHPVTETEGAWTLRAALPMDAAAIARIHVAAWRAAYRGIVPQAHLDAMEVVKRAAYWEQAIASGKPMVRVAQKGHDVIGWVAFDRSRDVDQVVPTGEIWAIYLDPDWVARGVGRNLFGRACAELEHRAFAQLTVWVLARNERAARFYSLAGFAPQASSTKTVTIGGKELQEVRYVRPLGVDGIE